MNHKPEKDMETDTDARGAGGGDEARLDQGNGEAGATYEDGPTCGPPTGDGGDEAGGDAAAVEGEADAAGPEAEADVGDGVGDSGGDPESQAGVFEIEVDGVRHQVPAALKGAFMMQADYTRKTMEVAELRRAIEAERASVREAGAEEVETRARLLALDEQAERFARVDWDVWENDDPFEAQKGWRQYQQLQQARGLTADRLAQLAQRHGYDEHRETATRIEQGRAVLARDIKGWSDALAASLLETGVKQYGFDRSEIEEFTDPRMVKVLHDAHQFHRLSSQRKQAESTQAAQSVRPAARVGGASPPAAGLDDRLSAEEWTRRREQQVRKKRG